MPAVTLNNDIEMDVLRQGDPDGPTLLMVMGLGAQRTWWAPELLDGLADEGFDVISFDNRDAGLTRGPDGLPTIGLDVLLGHLGGDRSTSPPYTLADMAEDAVHLLDALSVDRAHVVGASMGGMIAQHLAFSHPDRVASLTSIMSNTGDPATGQATEEAMQVLLTPAPPERDAYVEQSVRANRIIGSNTLFDEERARERAGEWFDRAYRPAGVARQLFAILADGNRTERLAGVTAPTLVIHGADDTLIQPDGGAATAAAIDGARLATVEAMGHDFPVQVVPQLASLIGDHVRASS